MSLPEPSTFLAVLHNFSYPAFSMALLGRWLALVLAVHSGRLTGQDARRHRS